MNLPLVTVSEAADQLGVVPQRVRALAQSGELAAVRTQAGWLIDADGLATRILLGELGATAAAARPWSQPIAWAAMRALDNDDALLSRLDRKSRYRLRRRMDAADPAYLLAAVRNRARRVQVSVHPSRAGQLGDLVVTSGIAGAATHGFGMTGGDVVDGYLTAGALAGAQDALGVRQSATGAHRLRVVDDGRVLEGLRVAPRLAVAGDLVDYYVDAGALDGRVVTTIKALLAQLPESSVHIANGYAAGASMPTITSR